MGSSVFFFASFLVSTTCQVGHFDSHTFWFLIEFFIENLVLTGGRYTYFGAIPYIAFKYHHVFPWPLAAVLTGVNAQIKISHESVITKLIQQQNKSLLSIRSYEVLLKLFPKKNAHIPKSVTKFDFKPFETSCGCEYKLSSIIIQLINSDTFLKKFRGVSKTMLQTEQKISSNVLCNVALENFSWYEKPHGSNKTNCYTREFT